MQRLGREVWAINTVEFSNHTGYGTWRGKALGGELAEELVSGLAERGVLSGCEAVLSGYLGDASVARAVAAAVRQARSASPKALYCCDPVMGDVGRGFYVKPDIPDMFKNEMVPLADIITPNQFELEALTGFDTRNIDEARRAVDMLHAKGPGVVLVTSYRHGGADGRQISMLASDRRGMYLISTPELPIGAGMAGSGDIAASVFLSRFLEIGSTGADGSGAGTNGAAGDIKKTLELCTASVFGILEASWRAYADLATKPELMELRIVQAQQELDSPSRFFEARKL
jgi:pyridoxine kinase